MLELQCVVQNYAWGKPGLESSVAQLKVRCWPTAFSTSTCWI